MLCQAADHVDSRGPRELLDLRELLVGIGSRGENGEHEPALGLEPRRVVGQASHGP